MFTDVLITLHYCSPGPSMSRIGMPDWILVGILGPFCVGVTAVSACGRMSGHIQRLVLFPQLKHVITE